MFFNNLRTGGAVGPVNVAGILVLLIACALLWFPGSPLSTGTSRKQDIAGVPKPAAPAASYRDLGNDRVQPNGTYAARDSNTTLAGGDVHTDFYGQEGTDADTKGPIIVFVMGASSSTNSSLGAALAASLGLPFTDADVLYPQGISKDMDMDPGAGAGDQQWLEALRDSVLRTLEDQADEELDAELGPEAEKGEAGLQVGHGHGHGVVVSFTALKTNWTYRDAFRVSPPKIECWCSGNRQCPQDCPCCPGVGMNEYYPATYFVDVAVAAGQSTLLEDRGMENRTGADDFGKAGVPDPESAGADGEENVVIVPLDVSTEEQVRVAREGLKALGAIRSEY